MTCATKEAQYPINCAGSGESHTPVRFDGFQVYRIKPQTAEQQEALEQLEENSMDYNFWTGVSAIEQPVDIMVPPHKKCDFQEFLELQKLESELWIENVQERIDNEKRVAPRSFKDHDWRRYQTLDELNGWLDALVEKYPRIVRSVVGGESYEGRSIKGVKVSWGAEPSCNATCAFKKRRVFLEGGIHAREWITPATVTYILNQLLTNRDPVIRKIAESREWHVFPCINPDGYVYSHTTNRMWRKNRRPFGNFFGVDLNRNWSYQWMQGRASLNPYSENHAGTSAFSEMETKTLSKYINKMAEFMEVYLAFHSYSQKILIPFSHNRNEKPINNGEHERIAQAAAESLASKYGTHFDVGNGARTLYLAGGVSVDWVKGVHRNVRLAYTYELRDKGTYGFLLPPDMIIPTANETFDSVLRIFKELDNI